MSRARLTLQIFTIAAVVILTAAPAGAAQTGVVILDLRRDPFGARTGAPLLTLEGPGADQIVFDADTLSAYPSDPAGSLLSRYDSTRPTTRAVAPLGAAYTEQDDFVFGAILTIRPEPFEADPFGFHPITFSLINAATTGYDRTGSLADFRSDAFDTIDVAYFPQVSPLFGGPFLSPAVFGSQVSDDAFANFSFGSLVFEIRPALPHLITAEHRAADRTLTVTVYALGRGGLPLPIPGARVETDLSFVTAFSVDTLAITAYEDGFNVFTLSGRSVRADVDYDHVFFAPGALGEEGALPALAGLIRRSGGGAGGVMVP